MGESKIKESHHATAEEFIEAISPRGPNFGPFSLNEKLFYRGHASSDWALIPSALRPEKRESLHRMAGTPPIIREHTATHFA